MAFVLADRVQETSTSPGGTGTLTLSGSGVPGFKTFSAGIGTGNTFYYTIYDPVTYEWEVGNGSWSANVLTRTTVLSNSLNTTAFISFTNGNTLYVWVDYPASKALYLDTSGNTYAPNLGATTPSSGDFTTLNSSGNTRLGGLSGNQSLQVNNVASGVNYLQVAGAATGNTPTISVQGSDTNIPFALSTKGSGGALFYTGAFSSLQFAIANTASAVNYLQVTGAVTGQYAALTTQGADANVGLLVNSKGTYPVTINSALEINPTTSSVNFMSFYGAVAGGAPVFVAKGSDANVAMGFTTKGTQGFAFYTNNFGAQQTAITHTASAVNYLQVSGGATGAAPTIIAQGSDTDVGLFFAMKGWNSIKFNSTTGGQLFQIGQTTGTTANYLQALGNSTGNAPTLSAQGSDSNISLALSPKGTGGITVVPTGTYANTLQFSQGYYSTLSYIGVTGTGSFAGVQYNATPASGGASHTFTAYGSPTLPGQNLLIIGSAPAGGTSVNYLNIVSNTTGLPPTISAQGSDANIDLVLTGKGTGVVALGGTTAASSGFAVNTPSGTVDAINIYGSSGSNPYFAAVGTSAIINLAFYSKGVSSTTFGRTGGTQNFIFASVASSVNYLQASPAITGSAPNLQSQGSDANINLLLIPKGSGTVQFGTYTAGILAQAGYITITDAGGTSRRLLVG